MKSHKKLLPYLLTFIMVFLMIGISIWLDEPEIIFPEITALTIGTWLAPKQIWKTSSLKLVALIMIYSLLGVIMVRYVELPIYLKINCSFFMCAIGLNMSRTTFSPLISACILPIIMETESWIYPLSATIMAFIIITVQKFLQSHDYHEKYHYHPVVIDHKHETFLLIKRMIVIAIMTTLAFYLDYQLIIAPPLIVAFFELSGNHKKLRSQSPKIFLFTVFIAFISAYARYYAVVEMHYSLLLVGALVTIILLLSIYIFKIYFPPVGAIAILPFIIDSEILLMYPALIAGGFILFILFAFLISYRRKPY